MIIYHLYFTGSKNSVNLRACYTLKSIYDKNNTDRFEIYKKNATRWFTTIFKMLFFVSFEKQQLFCGPELNGDLGPGFWFSDAGRLSGGFSTVTTPNMLKLKIAMIVASIAGVKLARCTF